MNVPFFKLTQTQEGWQAAFAYQVFHRPGDEWLRMRWGFNAGALLEEALDRYKLFVESQTLTEIEFHTGTMQNNTLVLRGVHSPEAGLQMVLLGKSCTPAREQAQQFAERYAREVFSTFPHDFVLVPARTESAYYHLGGEYLLARGPNIAQIHRKIFPLPKPFDSHYLVGLWQSSSRSNEQIWRALSAMPQPALLNILIRPAFLLPIEKHALLDIKKAISNSELDDETASVPVPWIKEYVNRRLGSWKRFFLCQVHLVVDGEMENLIRSIGSALTRDSDKLSLPGYQTRYPDPTDESRQWLENIRSLELTENTPHLDDLADVDEIFSIFRFPYRPPEVGLPGANFSEPGKGPDLSSG